MVEPLDGSVPVSASEIEFRLDHADSPQHERFPGEPLYEVAAGHITADEAVRRICDAHRVWIDRSRGYRIRSWDDYLIPGSFTLRNRIVNADNPDGLEDPDRFREIEQVLARVRMVELAIDPVLGGFDYDHVKEVHARVFQDVFHWAGDERIGPETAIIRFAPDTAYEPGDPRAPLIQHRFMSGPEMADAVEISGHITADLARRNDLSPKQLFSVLPEFVAEWWTIHPFRDGNVRAAWIFFTQLGDHLGLSIDPALLLAQSDMRAKLEHAMYRSMKQGAYENLEDIFARLVARSATPSDETRGLAAGA